MSNTRKTAVMILQEVLEQKVFFSDMREKYKTEIKGAEKFVSMLVLTALRKKCFLERTLAKFLQKSLRKKDIFAQYALFCAATELFYLNSPDYAVLNDYVAAVKQKNGKFLSAMVNAVLRKIATNKEELKKEDCEADLPLNFKEMLIKDYGKDTADLIEKTFSLQPALDLSMAGKVPDFEEKTGAIKLDESSYRITKNVEVGSIYGYEKGLWWVQDYAASLPVKMFSGLKGKKVLDLCASPGGKTAQLAAAGAIVTAVDVSAERLEKLAQNIKRLNFSEVKIVCSDALDFLQEYKGELFDAILVDAPCSATGTLRRHPEIPHIKDQNDISKMADLQKKFLNQAVKALKTGGELVYCVCSIFKAEGENIIGEFLQENKNFILETSKKVNLLDERIKTEEGYFRMLPFYGGGMDAFFAAKMKKI